MKRTSSESLKLSPNDVLISLWAKDSAEKCHIGLADAIIYNESGPSRWYVTGKHGEISKKRNLDLTSVTTRWTKIATHQQSHVIAIIRQKSGLLKFISVDNWENYCNDIWSDTTILSLHCFIKGRKDIIYRNTIEIKNETHKICTTQTYNLEYNTNTNELNDINMNLLTFNDCGNTSINEVMNSATSVVTHYLEKMLNIKINNISVDYIIDSQSQVWMLWTTEARFLRNTAVVSTSLTDNSDSPTNHQQTGEAVSSYTPSTKPSKRPSKFSFDTVSLNSNCPLDAAPRPTDTDTTHTTPTPAAIPSSISSYPIPSTTQSNILLKSKSKCKGDFCRCQLSQFILDTRPNANLSNTTTDPADTTNDTMNINISTLKPNSPFTNDEFKLIQKDIKSLLSTGQNYDPTLDPTTTINTNNQYTIAMKNILKARQENRVTGVSALQGAGKAEKVMTYYYEDAKICQVCYHVYTLIDKVRIMTANKTANGNNNSRIKVSQKQVVPTNTLPSASQRTGSSLLIQALNATAAQAPTPPPSAFPSPPSKVSRKQLTSATSSGTASADSPTKRIQHDMLRADKPIDLNDYLRNGSSAVNTSAITNSSVLASTDRVGSRQRDSSGGEGRESNALVRFPPIDPTTSTDPTGESGALVRVHAHIGKVLLACSNENTVKYLLQVLKDARYDVTIAREGRKAVNLVLDRIRSDPFDCILIQKDLVLNDAFAVTQAIRTEEKRLRLDTYKQYKCMYLSYIYFTLLTCTYYAHFIYHIYICYTPYTHILYCTYA